MKIYHILNGDCLASQLEAIKLAENVIICREALIEGPVASDNYASFWKMRSSYLSNEYNIAEAEYVSKTVNEFRKLDNLPLNTQVCLWFENDLFCQVNMWFVISMLSLRPDIIMFRVFPKTKEDKDKWKGFGIDSSSDLLSAFQQKKLFTQNDINLAIQLWKSYQCSDFGTMQGLSLVQSDCFQELNAVCQAHIERCSSDGNLVRPESTIMMLINKGITNFDELFAMFTELEGIYGFGDTQVKNIFDRLLQTRIN